MDTTRHDPAGRAWSQPDFTDGRGNAHPALHAIKALESGLARPDQQLEALRFVIERLCGTFDLSFRPSEIGGDRETAFAEGRRSVGLMLTRIVGLPMNKLVPPKADAEYREQG